METREYFEKVMQDYNQNRNGRSLRKYCKNEAVDYNWLMEFKKTYSASKPQTQQLAQSFIPPLVGGRGTNENDLGSEGVATSES